MKLGLSIIFIVIAITGCKSKENIDIHQSEHYYLTEDRKFVKEGHISGEERLKVEILNKSTKKVSGKLYSERSNEIIPEALIYEAVKVDSNIFALGKIIGETDTSGNFEIDTHKSRYIVFSFISFMPYVLEVGNVPIGKVH